jgi:hypothetical protein
MNFRSLYYIIIIILNPIRLNQFAVTDFVPFLCCGIHICVVVSTQYGSIAPVKLGKAGRNRFRWAKYLDWSYHSNQTLTPSAPIATTVPFTVEQHVFSTGIGFLATH